MAHTIYEISCWREASEKKVVSLANASHNPPAMIDNGGTMESKSCKQRRLRRSQIAPTSARAQLPQLSLLHQLYDVVKRNQSHILPPLDHLSELQTQLRSFSLEYHNQVRALDTKDAQNLHGLCVLLLAALSPRLDEIPARNDVNESIQQICKILRKLYVESSPSSLVGTVEAFTVVLRLAMLLQHAANDHEAFNQAGVRKTMEQHSLESCLSLMEQMAPVTVTSLDSAGTDANLLDMWTLSLAALSTTPAARCKTIQLLSCLASRIPRNVCYYPFTAHEALKDLQGYEQCHVEAAFSNTCSDLSCSLFYMECLLLASLRYPTPETQVKWTGDFLDHIHALSRSQMSEATEEKLATCLFILAQSQRFNPVTNPAVAYKSQLMYRVLAQLLVESHNISVKRMCVVALHTVKSVWDGHDKVQERSIVKALVKVIVTASRPKFIEWLLNIPNDQPAFAATQMLIRRMESNVTNRHLFDEPTRLSLSDILRICIVLMDSTNVPAVTRLVMAFVCQLLQQSALVKHIVTDCPEILTIIAKVARCHGFHNALCPADQSIVKDVVDAWFSICCNSLDAGFQNQICATIVRQPVVLDAFVELLQANDEVGCKCCHILMQLSDDVSNHCILARHNGLLAGLIRYFQYTSEPPADMNAFDRDLLKQRIVLLASVL